MDPFEIETCLPTPAYQRTAKSQLPSCYPQVKEQQQKDACLHVPPKLLEAILAITTGQSC